MLNLFTPEEHLDNLAQFVKGVELSGGTTPHVTMAVAKMGEVTDPLEKLWFAGCYALTYNWPTAERIFLEYRPGEFDSDDFLMWSAENWDGIFLRKERKAVYRKSFFAESARSYVEFSQWLLVQDSWPTDYLEALEMFTSRCKYMGRYIGIRWMEVMRRAYGMPWAMPDVRSDGGEHPRKALALLYPQDSVTLLGGNSKAEVAIADLVADRCLQDLRDYGLTLGYYDLQSLLCEYKQSVLGKKHYPGKSIDTEMDYFRKVYDYWGDEKSKESSFYSIREKAFPVWSRGESMGWNGVRKDLNEILVNHRITWSDLVYDYRATTDLSAPVTRDSELTNLMDLMI